MRRKSGEPEGWRSESLSLPYHRREGPLPPFILLPSRAELPPQLGNSLILYIRDQQGGRSATALAEAVAAGRCGENELFEGAVAEGRGRCSLSPGDFCRVLTPPKSLRARHSSDSWPAILHRLGEWPATYPPRLKWPAIYPPRPLPPGRPRLLRHGRQGFRHSRGGTATLPMADARCPMAQRPASSVQRPAPIAHRPCLWECGCRGWGAVALGGHDGRGGRL